MQKFTNLLPADADVKILKLVDYLLLNGYSVNSSGFYNGKAGISLCLFEIARFLDNEYIEEHASELLQEALLTKSEDIGFENGLSGIGYVLLYLIENKFVDADFEELFGSQQRKIEEYIEKLKTTEISKEIFIKYNLKIIFFLDLLLSHKIEPQHITELNFLFSNAAEQLLKGYASDIENKQNVSLKPEYLTFFETYLKAAVVCRNFPPSSCTLKIYTQLFTKNKLISNYTIGYYLDILATEMNDIQLKNIAEINRSIALENLYPETISLAQWVDLLHLLRQNENVYMKQIRLLEKEFFYSVSESDLERNLLTSIGMNRFIAGYESGIARFLLYWIYRNVDINIRSRMQFL